MNMPNWEYVVHIRVYIEKNYPKNGGSTGELLGVEHEFSTHADGFLEVCKILGQFDELVKEIRDARRQTT